MMYENCSWSSLDCILHLDQDMWPACKSFRVRVRVRVRDDVLKLHLEQFGLCSAPRSGHAICTSIRMCNL